MDFLMEKDDLLFVRLPAEVDHHHIRALADRIDEALFQGTVTGIVFDFSGTGFMDSSGIGLIVGRYRSVQSIGGQVFVRGLSDQMSRILRLSGIEKYIRKYEETI